MVVPRAWVPGVRIAAWLAFVSFLATSTCRPESLQDAWNAALAANQGLQAVQTGTAAAQRTLAAAKARAHADRKHGQRLHLAKQRTSVQEQSFVTRLHDPIEHFPAVSEPGVLFHFHPDECANLYGWANLRRHRCRRCGRREQHVLRSSLQRST